MTLTEFLTARLDEDEAAALYAPSALTTRGSALVRFDPARILREVKARRAIVGLLSMTAENFAATTGTAAGLAYGQVGVAYENAARLLAAVYADHPDYDEAWRP